MTETNTIPAEAKQVLDGIAAIRGDQSAHAERLAKHEKEVNERLLAIEKSMRKDALSLPGSEAYAKDYQMSRGIAAMFSGDWSKAGLEREVHEQMFKRLSPEMQQRIMTTLTPSMGGFLIPEEISTTLIPKLDPVSVVKKAGATVIKPNGWPYKVNKITGGTTAAYAAEGTGPSATDLTLGQVSFSPRKMSVRSVLTMEQVAYGSPQTDALIMQDFMKRLELLQDKWAIKGTGQQGEPIGILNTTGINTAAATITGSAKLSYADFSVAIQYLEEDEVISDNLSVVLHPTQKGELFRNVYATVSSGTLVNEGAAFVMNTPFMTAARFKELTGLNLFSTSQQTDGTGLVGDFSNLWLAEWGGVMITKSDIASDGTYHGIVHDVLHVKATRWCDSAVVQPVAFHTITSI